MKTVFQLLTDLGEKGLNQVLEESKASILIPIVLVPMVGNKIMAVRLVRNDKPKAKRDSGLEAVKKTTARLQQ